MPIEKTIKLFRYNELSDRAKERAREWYLETIDWIYAFDPVLDNWRELAERLGFTIDHNGGPWWDLYRNTFEIGRGSFYRPDDGDLDALKKEWGPNPETGWAGNPEVLSLIAAVRAIRPFMSATISDSRIYNVEGGEDHLEEPSSEFPSEEWTTYYEQVEDINEEEKPNIEEALSELQYLGLKWLRAEEEYLESEEAISETMEANGWLFHDDGSFAR